MSKKVRVDWDQTKEIAGHILKVDKDNAEDDYAVVEEALFNKWGIDLEIFGEICNELLKLIVFGNSPLTGRTYVGLAIPDGLEAKKEVDAKIEESNCN
ncbi:hypothetical protein MCERE19_02271 [Spirosomataceae bacterium]|jgi:hypothetical protein